MTRSHLAIIWRRLRHSQHGAALLEFALVAPFFLFTVFGLIEFGNVLWSYSTLDHAVQEAARFAMVHGAESGTPATADAVAEMVRDSALGLSGQAIAVTVNFLPDNQPGSMVDIDASYSVATALFGQYSLNATALQFIAQ
jgi:Flp pilus assembly protein TadG